jgi:hypothetical protein
VVTLVFRFTRFWGKSVFSEFFSTNRQSFKHGKFCLDVIRQCKELANLCHTIDLFAWEGNSDQNISRDVIDDVRPCNYIHVFHTVIRCMEYRMSPN